MVLMYKSHNERQSKHILYSISEQILVIHLYFHTSVMYSEKSGRSTCE